MNRRRGAWAGAHLAILGTLLVAPGTAAAQGCRADCLEIVEAMFHWVADEYDVLVSEIVVGEDLTGYEAVPLPLEARARPLPPPALAALGARLGFSVAPSWHEAWECEVDDPFSCRLLGAQLYIRFNAPAIEGDSASVAFEVTYERRFEPPRPPGRVEGRAIRMELGRTPEGWIVEKATVVGVT